MDKQAPRKNTLENIDRFLLFFCAVLVAARCHINESFPTRIRLDVPPDTGGIATAEVTTMVILASLISAAALVWLLIRLWSRELTWRKTALLTPLIFLSIAAVLSTTAASNKHNALIAAADLLSQILLAILLVQLLNTTWKQRFLLIIITATGVTMAYRCWEQHHFDSLETIKMYEKDPDALLQAQGLTPGTYQAKQYTARLYSRDIGGYFNISNTAAAFFILSCFATLALVQTCLPPPFVANLRNILVIIISLTVFSAQLIGLYLTQSKGGIAASVTAAFLLAVFWRFRCFLSRHWQTLLTSALTGLLLTVTVITIYGTLHDRLPTNSMWVRWQYWRATADMIADHAFTGVGPKNFGSHYPQYLNPAAPEVVKDPHSFPLALWSQWGILGLFGFLWAALAVTLKLIRPDNTKPHPPTASTASEKIPNLFLVGIIFILAVTFIRCLVGNLNPSSPEFYSVFLVVFLIPAVIWLNTYLLLVPQNRPSAVALIITGTFLIVASLPAQQNFHLDFFLIILSISAFLRSGLYLGVKNHTASPSHHANLTLISPPPLIIGSALLGFLLHNSIDFAIFNPAVGTCFFTLLALMLACHHQKYSHAITVKSPPLAIRIILTFILVISTGFFWFKLALPICKEQQQLKQARQFAHKGYLPEARDTLQKAAANYRLNPQTPFLLSQLYWIQWHRTKNHPLPLLENTIRNLEECIRRDPAASIYYRQLSDTYDRASRRFPQNKTYPQLSRQYARRALKRNPANSELLITYAQKLEQANQNEKARPYFQKALEIEKNFLRQQQQMYPNRAELVHRLNPQLRKIAEQALVPK